MFDPTPWMVRAARHSAALGRFVVHSLSGGAEGVIEPGDLKVTALGTPGLSVNAAAGGAFIRNTYGGGEQQTYAARGATTTNVPIDTNAGGGSARYDLVAVRVLDPEYHTGLVVADPLTFQYVDIVVVKNVPANAVDVPVGGISGNPPAYPLARIHMPAGASTVTAGQITDLRKVAMPRRERQMMTYFPSSTVNVSTTVYTEWPIPGPGIPIAVPEWATHLAVKADLGGILHSASSKTVAGIRVVFNGRADQNGIIIAETYGRGHYVNVGQFDVLAAERGTTRNLVLNAVRSEGAGTFSADYQSAIVVDWEFSEKVT